MSDPNPLDAIEAHNRANTLAWLDQLREAIAHGPGAVDFPFSVLLLAPALDANLTKLQWSFLCESSVPNQPDGWVQALYLSRDLLLLLARLDGDFTLGMAPLLTAAMQAHPLYVAPSASGPTH